MSNIQNSNGNKPGGFSLDKADAKIAGVCGGLAKQFNIDPLIVRLIFVVGAVAGFGSFILIYLLIWLLAN